MAIKERFQSPSIGDTVNLRTFAYNANARSNFQSVLKVEIYFLDPGASVPDNEEGKTLYATIDGDSIQNPDVGMYLLPLDLVTGTYTIGHYHDVWYVVPVAGEEPEKIVNEFSVVPSLWFTNTAPIIHDFNFQFRPNRIRKGAMRYLIVEVTPNVPTKSDLLRYYTNLAIVSPITISIEKECGDCVPEERDLRLIVDKEPIEFRQDRNGYYFLDTTELEHGIYNVWFEMQLGESYYISDKEPLQVF